MNEIKQIIESDIRAINNFFVETGIKAFVPVSKVVDGELKQVKPEYRPKVFNYGYIIYPIKLSTGESIGNISNRLEELSLEISRFRKSNMETTVRVIKTSTLALEVSLEKPAKLEITDSVDAPTLEFCGLVGKSFYQNTCYIEELCLDAHYQTLIAAKSGHGKSVLLKVALSTMLLGTSPDKLKVFIIDMKNDDLRIFRDLPHVENFAFTEVDSIATIDTIHEELNRRILEENKTQTDTILLVVDEIANLTMHSHLKETVIKLNTIMRLGRSYKIFGIYATQKPGEKYLKLVNDGFTHRIIGRCDNKTDAYYATGTKDSGAERLFQKGSFLICDERLQRVQVPFLSNETTAKIVAMIKKKWKHYVRKNPIATNRVSTTTTTTTNEKETLTPVVALVAVSSSASSSSVSSGSDHNELNDLTIQNSAIKVAVTSKIVTIADQLRDSFTDFENKAISLAGMIRLVFGQDANTGGSNRIEVLKAIELLRGERNENSN